MGWVRGGVGEDVGCVRWVRGGVGEGVVSGGMDEGWEGEGGGDVRVHVG